MIPPFTVRAPAKLNMTLHVTGKRADGRRSLLSAVIFPNLCDTLSVRPSETEKDVLITRGPFGAQCGPAESNLVIKALGLYRAYAGPLPPLHITLTKHIPTGAGLGGGSADAAALLRGLSTAARADAFAQGRILRAADALGSDVTCALFAPSPVLFGGAGERVRPAELPFAAHDVHVLLLCPPYHASTPAIFNAAEPLLKPRPLGPDAERRMFARFVRRPDFGALGHCRNDLREAAETVIPELREYGRFMDMLRGAIRKGMSGSGSSYFALFPARTPAEEALAEAVKIFPEAFSVCVLLSRKV